MIKFMQFEFGDGPPAVLKKEMLEESFSNLVASDGDMVYGDAVGFSAVRNESGHLVALGHGGLRIGFTASFEFDRLTKTGIILLSNSSSGVAEYKPLVRTILEELNPASRGGTGHPVREEH